MAATEKLWLDDIGVIDSEESAVKCAGTILEEAKRILNSEEGWSSVEGPKSDDVKLETKLISVAKLPVVRAAGRVECSASELYELLVSKEGVQLLNPSADLRDYDKPFLGPFPLRPEDEDGSSEKSSTDSQKPRFVQLERTVMKMPVVADREFVTANIKDGPNLLFIVSSVLSPEYPGGSTHQSEMRATRTWRLVRAVLAATYMCCPIEGEERACVFKVWQWLDVGGWLPASINRTANVQWFLPAYERIRAHVKKNMNGER